MSRFIDERLSNLEAYVPGEQPKPGEFIKLNTNEFPYPPANSVKKAARRPEGLSGGQPRLRGGICQGEHAEN